MWNCVLNGVNFVSHVNRGKLTIFTIFTVELFILETAFVTLEPYNTHFLLHLILNI
jgi:hypothetical protein